MNIRFSNLLSFVFIVFFSFFSIAKKKNPKINNKTPQKWHLQKINTKKTWKDYSRGNRDIIVAVIDTGIDTRHPDLKNNIWKNVKEIPGNNKDDDKNGYIDDVNGWNFVNNNNKTYDTHGHGTHIAGIIGAIGANNIGVSGVAQKVSLMALKYYDPNDSGKNNLNNTIKAIRYAVQNGAHIINYSGGGLEGNEEEKKAIQEAEKKGILFIAAAGNEKSNLDKKTYYPASYKLKNILSVTAVNNTDHVLKSSNWGKSVDISAPGSNILSTLPGGKYGYMTGTSQGTALATGSSVLVMSFYKTRDAFFVIKQLKMTGNKKKQIEGKTKHGSVLNAHNAIQSRPKGINFNDENVDSHGTVIMNTKTPMAPNMPFDLKEINTINQILSQPNLVKDTKKQKKTKKVLSKIQISLTKLMKVLTRKNEFNNKLVSDNGQTFSTESFAKNRPTKKDTIIKQIQKISLLVSSQVHGKDILVKVNFENKASNFLIKKPSRSIASFTQTTPKNQSFTREINKHKIILDPSY